MRLKFWEAALFQATMEEQRFQQAGILISLAEFVPVLCLHIITVANVSFLVSVYQ